MKEVIISVFLLRSTLTITKYTSFSVSAYFWVSACFGCQEEKPLWNCCQNEGKKPWNVYNYSPTANQQVLSVKWLINKACSKSIKQGCVSLGLYHYITTLHYQSIWAHRCNWGNQMGRQHVPTDGDVSDIIKANLLAQVQLNVRDVTLLPYSLTTFFKAM